METPAYIWSLIARSLNGEAEAGEQVQLQELLQNDIHLQQQYELLTRIWAEKGQEGDEDPLSAEQIITRIISQANSQPSLSDDEVLIGVSRRGRLRKRRWTALAAMLLLATGSFVFWKFAAAKSIKPANDMAKVDAIITQNGSRTRSLLPDGTTVWLNAGSKLYYDDDFSGPTREVRLEGEAFFDVVKQPNHPFIVHTGNIDIKVLGTAFNVKSYPEDKTVETTLYRGIVNVSRHDDPAKTIVQLRPNEKLVLAKEAAIPLKSLSVKYSDFPKAASANFLITPIDSTKKESERFETAWMYSRLEFRGDNFEELAKKLERWYNVTIVFTDDVVKQINFNGSFERETVEQAFTALQTANSFNYKINKHEISISSSQ